MRYQRLTYLFFLTILVWVTLFAAGCRRGVPHYELVSIWNTASSLSDSLQEPMGIDVTVSGQVYVADIKASRVIRYAADGAYELQWSLANPSRPIDVAVGNNGIIYIVDFAQDQVATFTPTGEALITWGGPGTDLGRFSSPSGVAVGPDGLVYVADFQNHRVQVFKPEGSVIRSMGTEGHGTDELYYPTDVAIAVDGGVYVADAYNNRVYSFDGVQPLTINEGLSVPVSVVIGTDGTIHVADSENHRLVAFSAQGEELASFLIPGGSDNGINTPAHIAQAPDGKLYVTDPAHACVLVVQWSR